MPNTRENENCVVVGLNTLWQNTKCEAEQPAICEVPEDVVVEPNYFPECGDDMEVVTTYSVHEEKQTWQIAQDRCTEMGGSLASLYTPYADLKVFNMIKGGCKGGYWFGLKQDAIDEPWYNIDGAPNDYMNWDRGQPQRNKEHCGMINWSHNHKWHDGRCHVKKPFICNYHSKCQPKQEIKTEVTVLNTPRNFEDSERACQNIGGHLASINTPAQQERVEQSLNTLMGPKGVQDKEAFWIGLSINTPGADFTWADGSKPEFEYWAPGEPKDKKGGCVQVGKGLNTMWYETKCENERKPICDVEKDVVVKDVKFPKCPTGQFFETSYEVVYEAKSWHVANDICVSKGGHLASLYDEASDAAVYELVKDGDNFGFWFGLYQEDGSKPWMTMDGAPITYTNWDQGQPQKNKEHCGMINWAGKAKWHDGNCNKQRSFICSFHSECMSEPIIEPVEPEDPVIVIDPIIDPVIKPVVPEEPVIIVDEPVIEITDAPNTIEYHFLNTPMPAHEAEEKCREEFGTGAHLASMNTPKEVENLNTIVRDMHIEEAWIGLNSPRKTEPFRWTDGSPNTLSMWAPDQKPEEREEEEGCVEAVQGLNTLEWKVVSCSKPLKPLCSKRSYDSAENFSPNTPF